MASRRYSRLAKLEAKKAKRQTFFFILASILLIAFLLWFGLAQTPKLINLASGLAGREVDIVEDKDIIPPPPPRIDILSEFTSETEIKVSGNAESGSTVIFVFNDTQKELLAGDNGDFSTTLSLQKGENKLKATAIDRSGNKSSDSKEFIIIQDAEPPEIEINNPQDKAEFFGIANQKLSIQGNLKEASSLTVNGRVVIINENGEFDMPITLAEGENVYELVATDEAGNEAKGSLTISFTP